jgi:hypothetical protein
VTNETEGTVKLLCMSVYFGVVETCLGREYES